MKKVCLLILFSIFFLLDTVCYATTFSEPVKIGSYMNSRGGGPSLAYATGYTSSTDVSFTFGEGDSALTFVYKNDPTGNGRGASFTVGVLVGNSLCNKLRCGDVPEIYRITSDDGITVYVGEGRAAGLEQVFFLIARTRDGYTAYTSMSDLAKYIPNIEFVDNPDTVRLSVPICKENVIAIPFQSRTDSGLIIFEWNTEKNKYSVHIPTKYTKR